MRLVDADKLSKLHPEIADLLNEAPTENAIVLPYNPGDSMWYIGTENGFKIKKYKEVIRGVAYYGDGKFKMISEDGEIFEPGGPCCCLSIEEAEVTRAKMLEELTYEEIRESIRCGYKTSPLEWEPFLQEIKDMFLKKIETMK